MWHHKVWRARVSSATCPNSELQRRMIGSSTGPRGNIYVLHMVLPTDLGYFALAFCVEGFQPFYVHSRALHGPGGPARAGLYNFEKPSGRAGPRSFWAGPDRAGQHTAHKVAMTSLIADRGV